MGEGGKQVNSQSNYLVRVKRIPFRRTNLMQKDLKRSCGDNTLSFGGSVLESLVASFTSPFRPFPLNRRGDSFFGGVLAIPDSWEWL